MKKYILLFLALVSLTAYSQDPNILWQRTVGGAGNEQSSFIINTADGGFLVGGRSNSNISGEKTENSFGEEDIWVLKFNVTGDILWQRTLGGNAEDKVNTAKETSDGGYILIGTSSSDISGNKTENSRGGSDYWIIKLDAEGNISWQKTYGGSENENGRDVILLDSGGFLILGHSLSGISGDRTLGETLGYNGDCWMLILDENGNLNSQRKHVVFDAAFANSLEKTPDGGYAIGSSYGDANSTFELTKYNSQGNFLWVKNYGGDGWDILKTFSVTSDGGFIVTGFSDSNISGVKTEDSRGLTDYWVLKLSSIGDIEWQKTLGGEGGEEPNSIIETSDNGYLVTGFSPSNISGDKTENVVGGADYWIIKLNSVGLIEWQNNIGGIATDARPMAILNNDGSFIISGYSNSDISGDKTENSRGGVDFWILKHAQILGTEENKLFTLITIYPNPAKNNLQINTQDQNIDQINIYSLTGNKLMALDVNTVSPNIDVSTLASGVYFIQFYSGKNVVLKKFIKE